MCLPGTIERVREQADEQGIRGESGAPPRLDRRSLLAAGLGAAVAAALPDAAAGEAGGAARRRTRLQDLTHEFRTTLPVYTFEPPSRRTLVTVEENGFYSQEWKFGEHSGTHMDAPGHFIARGRRSPQITLQELMVPIVVVDISARAARNPDAVVTVTDLRRFERRHGRIPRNALVAMYSGWDKKINTPAFKGGELGNYHFPGFSERAANWLLRNRDITGIGVDTLSLDPGISSKFPVHLAILGANKYGLEGLNNLNRIPPRGATAFVGLIPWEEGSGGPARVVASWPARGGSRLAG